MGGCNRCVCIQSQCLKKREHPSTHHFWSAVMDLKVAAVAVCLCVFFVTSTEGNYQDQGDTCEEFLFCYISAHSEMFRSRQKVQCVAVCVLQRYFIEIEVLLTFDVVRRLNLKLSTFQVEAMHLAVATARWSHDGSFFIEWNYLIRSYACHTAVTIAWFKAISCVQFYDIQPNVQLFFLFLFFFTVNNLSHFYPHLNIYWKCSPFKRFF